MKQNLSIDNIKSIDNKNCNGCGILLTIDNVSIWNILQEINSKEVFMKQCVMCNEINNRMLTNAKITNEGIIPQKTKEQCIKEIKRDGLTIEILKAIEEKSLINNNN
jgi:hypothetical protein